MYDIKVNGLSELGKTLSDLGEEIAIKALTKSGKVALEPVLDDMKQNAGFDSESNNDHMRDSIKIRKKSSKRSPYLVRLSVGPTKKHRIKALVQEYGSIKQIPKAFIRPALDYNKMKVLAILKQEIRKNINQIKNRG